MSLFFAALLPLTGLVQRRELRQLIPGF
jgi:hypothetical protein